MKTAISSVAAALALLALSAVGLAQTTFTNAGGWLSVEANWDNGLPTSAGNPGTINTNGRCGATVLTNYYVTQTGGSINMGVFPDTDFRLDGGEWTMDGGSLGCRNFTLDGGSRYTLNGGTFGPGLNGSATGARGGSTLTMNGGTADLPGALQVGGSGSIIEINDVAVSVVKGLGGYRWWGRGGKIYFNGATVTAANLDAGHTSPSPFVECFFGGTTTGSVTAGDILNAAHISLDFLPSTLMSLTLTSATNTWAQDQWDINRLLYNGQSKIDLGKTWAEVTSAGGLDKAYHFVFDGTTLSLGAAPRGFLITVH